MMASHSALSISYWCAEKYFGAYFPAGDAAFSLRTAWCTNSAAWAGMTCNTEPPTAPIASVLRMSRRVTLCELIRTSLSSAQRSRYHCHPERSEGSQSSTLQAHSVDDNSVGA